MKIIKIGSLCFIILCFFAVDCFAFRCGSGLVSFGDTKTRVLVTCGKPISKESSCTNSQVSTTTAVMKILSMHLLLKTAN
jgi:hypothetical protein